MFAGMKKKIEERKAEEVRSGIPQYKYGFTTQSKDSWKRVFEMTWEDSKGKMLTGDQLPEKWEDFEKILEEV